MNNVREFSESYELEEYLFESPDEVERMNFEKMYRYFDSLKIPRGAYILGKRCLDGNGTLCFHYDKCSKFWVVYVSERGAISNPAFFASFHSGAQYLMWELIHYTGVSSIPVLRMDSGI